MPNKNIDQVPTNSSLNSSQLSSDQLNQPSTRPESSEPDTQTPPHQKPSTKLNKFIGLPYFRIALVIILFIAVSSISFYKYSKSKQNNLNLTDFDATFTPGSETTELSDKLSPCLEIQKEHTHEVFTSGSSSGPNLGMPAPEYFTNTCEQKAKTTESVDEMNFLLNSKDPVVLISLASNQDLPADIQWELYKNKTLPDSWDGIGQTLYQFSESPKEELLRQLTSNMNLDPEILEDLVNRFINKDPEISQLLITNLIQNPNTYEVNPAATPLLGRLVRLNNLVFNALIADTPGLDEETVRYLGQNIEYELSDSQKLQYDKSSPLYRNYPTPNFEVHSLLMRSNDVPKELITAHLYEIRDHRRVQISQENFAIVADVILTDQMRDYFFASTDIGNNGVNQGRYTYVFNLLFQGIGLNEKASSENLQLLIDTYADAEIKRILKEEKLNYIPTMKKIDRILQKKYPDWHSFGISALRNALMNAQKNLNKRTS